MITKAARKEYHRKHWQLNKHKYKTGQIRRDKERQAILDGIKKGASCALCGYSKYPEALDFHHTVPENKSFYISRGNVNKENFIEEICKCIVLCANCHRYITRIEKNYRMIKNE